MAVPRNSFKTHYAEKKKLRMGVHFGFSIVLFFTILVFQAINDESVITSIFKAAGYTYGPLLGLFAFGIFTDWKVKDRLVPVLSLLSPIITYIINLNSEVLFGGYKFGFEILILNGLIMFHSLVLIKRK